jgi:2-phosphoglycerate kinase
MDPNVSTDVAPHWRVLLVGGASGVGKTVAARVVARRLGISQLYVDDVRMAIQRVTTPEQQPALFYFLQPQVWQQPPEALLAGFMGVAEALVPALEAIIAHHVGVPSVDPVLIEGDGIAPALAATTILHNLLFGGSMPLEGKLRAVYVDEPSEEELLAHMLERGRGFEASPSDEQRRIAHACWRYGQWLTAEAGARGVPVVPARPFASLPERILAVAGRKVNS